MTRIILLIKKNNFTITDNFISDLSDFLSIHKLKCDIVCINNLSYDLCSNDFDFIVLEDNINLVDLSDINKDYNIDASISNK